MITAESTGVDTPVLVLGNMSRRYGSLVALDDVSLTLRAGTVHALLGENGAGKSTLMRVAFGMVRPDAGTVHIDGRLSHISSPAAAIAAGLGMVHQHFTLVPSMTVAENVALGGRGLFRRQDSVATVRDIASRTGFALDPHARVEDLPVGAQQRVEIAKALARGARLLILDEPTAVLAPREVDDLLRWLRAFVAEGNAAVIITHKLREALAVADDLTVLRRGRVVHVGRAGVSSTAALTAAMIGEESVRAAGNTTQVSAALGAVVFRSERLSICDERGTVRVHGASFEVRGGEIVGVVGIEGAGQRELLRALAGRRAAEEGVLVRPADVGFVPEDRHHDAVLLDRPLVENVALRGAGSRRGTIEWTSLRARTSTLLQAFDVRAPSDRSALRTLSGGNQQRLVLAREMGGRERPAGEPRAIVAENPTRGLDVRATADVHARLRAARDGGAAIVMYSSDLDEVLLLASRVLVAHAGAVREVPPERDAVARAMLGLD